MYCFLMITTVGQHKDIAFITINKEEDVVHELMKLALDLPDPIFFPIMNKEDVERVSEHVNDEWKQALFNQIKDDTKVMGFQLRGQCVRARSIEHFKEDVFNITSDSGIFTVDYFIPCITYAENS